MYVNVCSPYVSKARNQQCILRVSVKHSFDGNIPYFVTLEIQHVTCRSPGSQNTFLSTQLQCAEGKQSYIAICYKVWNIKKKKYLAYDVESTLKKRIVIKKLWISLLCMSWGELISRKTSDKLFFILSENGDILKWIANYEGKGFSFFRKKNLHRF